MWEGVVQHGGPKHSDAQHGGPKHIGHKLDDAQHGHTTVSHLAGFIATRTCDRCFRML